MLYCQIMNYNYLLLLKVTRLDCKKFLPVKRHLIMTPKMVLAGGRSIFFDVLSISKEHTTCEKTAINRQNVCTHLMLIATQAFIFVNDTHY